jgi:hypothetical protein
MEVNGSLSEGSHHGVVQQQRSLNDERHILQYIWLEMLEVA